MASSALSSRCIALWTAWVLLASPASAQPTDPAKLLEEADRLAWMKSWARAEPLFAEAEKAFAAKGDRLNTLHAQVSRLRSQLARRPVPEVSRRLGDYLDNPSVQGDDRLLLRVLVAKGETDEDLDPASARKSWQAALTLAEKLGEAATANRARGELGVVAALLGEVGASVIQLGTALKVAQANGDMPSVVRWLTLFGRGFAEMDRAADAVGYYDRALTAAATVPELTFPVMTYLGKGEALVKLGRLSEAEVTLTKGLDSAAQQGSLAYQAELSLKLAVLAEERKAPQDARRLLTNARDFAQRAGASRILAQVALEGGRILRAQSQLAEASALLESGIAVARTMQERMALPRLLAELAEVRASERRFVDAADLLEEGSDLLEGLLSKASSPWVQGRIINGARDIMLARIRLEGMRGPAAARLFAIIEQARGRALLELLRARPVAAVAQPAALRKQEQEIAKLQRQLFQPMSRAARRRLLDRILAAEEALAPMATEVFDRTRRSAVTGETTLTSFQQALKPNELFVAFALVDPQSFVVIASSQSARVQTLEGRAAVRRTIEELLDAIRGGRDSATAAIRLGSALLSGVKELSEHDALVVSPDAELHQVPFELLDAGSGKALLQSHSVSYVPSASVLSLVRARRRVATHRPALAVSSSPEAGPPANNTSVSRSVFDLDGSQLRPLPSANDEARAVAAAMGEKSTLLLGEAATEAAIRHLPLQDYRLVHFAVHGIPSTRFPARSALLVRPAGDDDGLLQAREILGLRFGADLVTLSACDTGSGSLHEQEGVTSLVRPFLAAGARAVVANLWAAEDKFSLTMMREFYRQLSTGAAVGEALRRAKLRMLEMFGPEAVPRLWSGVLAYGDAGVRVVDVGPQQEDKR
ncbi:MAG: CHAT domain-containing protein [Chloroflexi bacterium]|nr:CHAT domain-containing protein [Chloroflexota bacterium]